MIKHLILFVLLAVSWASIGTSTALASPWYEGEWKHDAGGVGLAVRFGSNGNGVLNLYKNGSQIGGGNIKWKKEGSLIIATRNGVDINFKLDERRKVVQTADGTPMKRIGDSEPAKSGGCEEACWANNASNNDLKKKYGRTTAPSSLAWGRPFAEGAGQRAFMACIRPHGLKAITDPVIAARCNKAASSGCVTACLASGKSR